jgi:Protein of unknown function (DUF1064)
MTFSFKKKYVKKDHARVGSSKKFGNIKITCNIGGVDYNFDSKFEAEIAQDLYELKCKGIIKDCIFHPTKIKIFPTTYHPTLKTKVGTPLMLMRELCYHPDYLIILNDGREVYADAKGKATIGEKDFIIKMKTLYCVHNIYVVIFLSCGSGLKKRTNWQKADTIKKLEDNTFVNHISEPKLKAAGF